MSQEELDKVAFSEWVWNEHGELPGPFYRDDLSQSFNAGAAHARQQLEPKLLEMEARHTDGTLKLINKLSAAENRLREALEVIEFYAGSWGSNHGHDAQTNLAIMNALNKTTVKARDALEKLAQADGGKGEPTAKVSGSGHTGTLLFGQMSKTTQWCCPPGCPACEKPEHLGKLDEHGWWTCGSTCPACQEERK